MITDYSTEAERLLKPQQVEVEEGFRALRPERSGPTRMIPADPVAAQVLATLAVASQLGRIADALIRLAGGQEDAGPQ